MLSCCLAHRTLSQCKLTHYPLIRLAFITPCHHRATFVMVLAKTFITGSVTHGSNQRLIIHVDSPNYKSEAFLVALMFESCWSQKHLSGQITVLTDCWCSDGKIWIHVWTTSTVILIPGLHHYMTFNVEWPFIKYFFFKNVMSFQQVAQSYTPNHWIISFFSYLFICFVLFVCLIGYVDFPVSRIRWRQHSIVFSCEFQ